MKKIFSGKIRWLLLGVAVLVIAGGAYYYYTRSAQTSTSTQTPVQTATAFRGSIVLQANGTGTLAPAKEVSFGFGTSGQIIELNVKIGDHLEAGQVIGKLDDTDAQAAYEKAQRDLADLTTPAAIAEAQQAVAEAEVDVTNALANLKYLISPDVWYWEGKVATAQETLQAAQTASGSNPTADQKKKIDDATADISHAQTNLQAAQLSYINVYAPAFFTQTVTDQKTDTTATEVVPPSDAEIAAARATYQLDIEKQKEAQAYLDMLNGKALPKDVPGSSLTSLVEAQTALQTAENNLKATQLISPLSGTVTSLTANVGDRVGTSSIITVADLSQPYTIEAYFDAEDWTNVQAGYETQVAFDVLPDKTFAGKVTVVYPGLDSSSNTSLVHAIVKLDENVDASLPIGASASVDVIGNQAKDVVLVPIEALHQAGEKYAVFVQQNDGKLKLKVVEVGLKDSLYAEIKSGLEAGAIVTTGITVTQ